MRLAAMPDRQDYAARASRMFHEMRSNRAAQFPAIDFSNAAPKHVGSVVAFLGDRVAVEFESSASPPTAGDIAIAYGDVGFVAEMCLTQVDRQHALGHVVFLASGRRLDQANRFSVSW